jgi:hypothetical protein
MNNKFLLAAAFLLLISLPVNNSFSQQLYKSFEVPGGGSGTTNSSVDSNDDYILYIVGGAVIVGVIVYALLKSKKEKPKDDTTAVILKDEFLEKQLTLNDQIQKYQSQIPINILFGMQNNYLRKEEKRYFVGIAYNF